MNILLAPLEADLPDWVEKTASEIKNNTYREAYLAAARLQTVRNLAEVALQRAS